MEESRDVSKMAFAAHSSDDESDMATSYLADQQKLVEQFRLLAEQWRRETGMHSSISKKLSHPAYQSIIAMGPSVIPLILDELKCRPGFWFEALKLLSGEDPAANVSNNDFDSTASAWLAWGKAKGHL